MKTRIDGQLLTHAETRRYTDGTTVVVVLVAPDQAGSLPVLAERAYGTTPAGSYAASNSARLLRKGARVELHGMGLSFDKHAGLPVVRLHAVTHIGHEVNPSFYEPEAAAAV
ncbi:MAG: hypothetical protein RBT42_07670 [Aquabacterium sp.]|jgi:hypothetical protein|uniref:hypothetical protein n=1 Tax=Aquabacterium sp. TaxID=1872578 RepID=UPI002A36982F|nr:hypothetical protein [Aquabacterium sp.]MDX9843621.1 hypothetical protein [Aquabacterium sp.]